MLALQIVSIWKYIVKFFQKRIPSTHYKPPALIIISVVVFCGVLNWPSLKFFNPVSVKVFA